LIGRIGERQLFQRLRHDGRRAHTPALWCRFLDDPAGGPPRVAFSIGRPVGSAVVRNRLRRRLRAIVAGLARGDAPAHASGSLLIGARPTAVELSFDQLEDQVKALVQQVAPRGPARGRL
jgi:ribonuclease P protein component